MYVSRYVNLFLIQKNHNFNKDTFSYDFVSTCFYGKKNAQNRNQNQEKTPDIVHMYCILIGKGNMGFHIGLSVVPSIHTIDLTFWLGNW